MANDYTRAELHDAIAIATDLILVEQLPTDAKSERDLDRLLARLAEGEKWFHPHQAAISDAGKRNMLASLKQWEQEIPRVLEAYREEAPIVGIIANQLYAVREDLRP